MKKRSHHNYNHNNTAGIYFKIKNTKLYVSVVTLSINDNIKFLKIRKQGFREEFLETNIDLK